MSPTTADFAKTLHDAYIRSGPYPQKVWEELDEADRALVVKVYDQVFKNLVELAMGQVADGKPAQLLLSSSDAGVRIDLGAPMTWFGFQRDDAINFAIRILQMCKVPVNIQIGQDPV